MCMKYILYPYLTVVRRQVPVHAFVGFYSCSILHVLSELKRFMNKQYWMLVGIC
jgi:hypothetical protein